MAEKKSDHAKELARRTLGQASRGYAKVKKDPEPEGEKADGIVFPPGDDALNDYDDGGPSDVPDTDDKKD